jgi:hypothetical protein
VKSGSSSVCFFTLATKARADTIATHGRSEKEGLPRSEDMAICKYTGTDNAKRYYISGPMTGIPDVNRPAFNETAERLRNKGYFVFSPGEEDDSVIEEEARKNGLGQEWAWGQFLKRDLRALLDCDAVVVLPGWRRSKGATLEVHVAQTLGLPVLDAYSLNPITESVTQEAHRLVEGDRGADYDHPLDNFRKTAVVWTGILDQKLRAPITEEEVGLLMVGVKLAREAHHHKRDNLVDVSGYAQTVQMVIEERVRRNGEKHG